MNGVFKYLASTVAAEVKLFATEIAIHEDDLAIAFGWVGGGRSGDGDHALAIDGNLAVLLGHFHLGDLHLFLRYVGLADVLTHGGECFGFRGYNDFLLGIEGDSIPELGLRSG